VFRARRRSHPPPALQLRTIADVTDVRIQANVRELARRGAEEKRRTAREARLKEESLTAAKANAAAVMRWADLLERQLPQELASELASQQVACNAVLASKAAILARLEGDLAAKEEEFASVLAAQKADVAALLERMQAQFVEMRDGYEVGLTEVEAAFSAERAALAAANKKEIDAAFDARRSLEAKYVEDRLTKEETWATELYDTQSVDAENYARLKAKLETDVSILEQQLEHMKVSGGVPYAPPLPSAPYPTPLPVHVPAECGEARVQLPSAVGEGQREQEQPVHAEGAPRPPALCALEGAVRVRDAGRQV
jgi:hypothetical protein